MTWVIIVWCVLILVWAVVGGAGAHQQNVQDCLQPGFLTRQQCQDAADAGTGLGVVVILLIGFIGFVFLSLIWLMTGRRKRDCPACGNSVKRGKTVCPSCGHDFAAAAARVAPGQVG
jgi:zinc-ribbon domain